MPGNNGARALRGGESLARIRARNAHSVLSCLTTAASSDASTVSPDRSQRSLRARPDLTSDASPSLVALYGAEANATQRIVLGLVLSEAATNEQSWGQSQPSEASGSPSLLSSALRTMSVAEAGFSEYVRGALAAAARRGLPRRSSNDGSPSSSAMRACVARTPSRHCLRALTRRVRRVDSHAAASTPSRRCGIAPTPSRRPRQVQVHFSR